MNAGDGTDQDLDTENMNQAENVNVGRDLTMVNESNQEARSGPEKFPIEDPMDHGRWVNFFDKLISILPLEIQKVNTAFKVIFFASWVVGGGSFASVIQVTKPVVISLPFDYWLLGIAVLAGVISGKYFDVRDATDCPSCGTPFSLETKEVYEYPKLSDSSKRRGERTVVCEHCGYKDTKRVSWEPDDE